MSIRASRFVLLGVFAWLLAIGIISAVVWTVDDDDPTADFSNVQFAINASICDSTVCDEVRVRCGVYSAAPPLNVQMKNGVSVVGDDPECTILDGGLAGTVVTFVNIEENMSLGIPPTVLSGFTIRNGRAPQGGGIFLDRSTPIITHNLIIGNEAIEGAEIYSGRGGGIAAYNESDPRISDNLIAWNTAEFAGGGTIPV